MNNIHQDINITNLIIIFKKIIIIELIIINNFKKYTKNLSNKELSQNIIEKLYSIFNRTISNDYYLCMKIEDNNSIESHRLLATDYYSNVTPLSPVEAYTTNTLKFIINNIGQFNDQTLINLVNDFIQMFSIEKDIIYGFYLYYLPTNNSNLLSSLVNSNKLQVDINKASAKNKVQYMSAVNRNKNFPSHNNYFTDHTNHSANAEALFNQQILDHMYNKYQTYIITITQNNSNRLTNYINNVLESSPIPNLKNIFTPECTTLIYNILNNVVTPKIRINNKSDIIKQAKNIEQSLKNMIYNIDGLDGILYEINIYIDIFISTNIIITENFKIENLIKDILNRYNLTITNGVIDSIIMLKYYVSEYMESISRPNINPYSTRIPIPNNNSPNNNSPNNNSSNNNSPNNNSPNNNPYGGENELADTLLCNNFNTDIKSNLSKKKYIAKLIPQVDKLNTILDYYKTTYTEIFNNNIIYINNLSNMGLQEGGRYKRYKIHVGQRGGKYIIKNKKKIYFKK
jgi:hypothetical protein